MTQAPEAAVRDQSSGPRYFLPLVRHLSSWLTPRLVRLPVSANHITAASLVLGLGCAWSVFQGGAAWTVAGAVLFIASTVLDYCDGAVARLKNQCTTFGMHFDSFADWVVHTGFFIRHSPYAIQIRGIRTTFPPPRELYPLCSHPMA